MKRGRARLQGEYYTWRILWSGAVTLQERGRPDESGNWFLTLGAMLLCYSALEAYLNYIGPLLLPQEWANEKSFFSKGRHRGTLGKLALLQKRCGLSNKRDRRPWQTLKELNRRRDLFMHPRSESWDHEVTYTDPENLKRIDPKLFALVDEDFVDMAMEDIRVVCDPLHRAAAELLGGGPAFGLHAFIGMIGHQGQSLL